MNHLVDNDVLQALVSLLGEFCVDPDSRGLGIASSPPRPHPLDPCLVYSGTDQRLPLCNKPVDVHLKPLSIPAVEYCPPMLRGRPRANLDLERMPGEPDALSSWLLDDLQPVAPAAHVVALTVDHLPLGLPQLLGEDLLLLPDPAKFRGDGEPRRLIVNV